MIGQLARASGVSVRMLRHYDRMGLLHPGRRTSAGYREYTEADITRLMHIEALRSLGLGLAEVGTALDDPDFDPAAAISGLRDDLQRRIEEAERLVDLLDGLSSTLRASDTTGELLAALELVTTLRHGTSRARQDAALRVGPAAGNPPDSGVELVRAYLDEPDDNAAGALLWAARQESLDGAATALLAATALRGGEVTGTGSTRGAAGRGRTRRLRSLVALGQTESAESAQLARRTLRECLADADARVAARAAVILGGLGDGAAGEALLDAIERGIADVEAGEVLAGLAVAEPGLVDRLAGRIEGASARPESRLRLVQALGELPWELCAVEVDRLCSDPDERVARIAQYLWKVHTGGPDHRS
nr:MULTISPECIES: MerR family transcriptional regulator [unclassified Brevibacterium]